MLDEDAHRQGIHLRREVVEESYACMCVHVQEGMRIVHRWTRGVRYRAPGRRRRGELVHWFDDSSGVGAVHLTGACGLSWGASSQRDAPWDPT